MKLDPKESRQGACDVKHWGVVGEVIPLHESRKTHIRMATFADVVPVHATLEKARALLDTPFPAPDMPYALQVLLDLVAQNFLCVAVDGHGSIVGVMALDVCSWPWCHPNNQNGKYLYNQHFWVEPSHRSGGAGVKLLDWAKRRAVEANLPLMIEMASLDGAVDKKDAFVKGSGFEYLGGKFFRKPNR